MNMPSVGIIGAGSRGMQILRLCAKHGSLGGVADTHSDLVRRIRSEFPGVPIRTNPQQIFASAVNVVAIATPAHTHVQFALDAIACGKHVFVVKPLAMSEEGALAVAAKAQRAGLSVFVEHDLLYHPAIVAQRALVERGAIGDVVHIRARHFRPDGLHGPENVWWRLAPDAVAYIIALLGDPISVAASENSRARGVLTNFVYADLQFAGSRSAHIEVTSLDPQEASCIDIFGTQGVASVETAGITGPYLTLHMSRRGRPAKKAPATGFEAPSYQYFPNSDALENTLLAFLTSFRNDAKPIANVAHAVSTARTLAAVTRAGAHQIGEFVVPGTRQYVYTSNLAPPGDRHG